jgi:hypothetical protein
MSSPLQVRIARDGKEIGTYDLAEVLRLLAAGTLKPTDFYWHEGMGARELLSKLDTSAGLRLPAEPEVKPQSDNGSNGCCGGCGLFIFLICGLYSVFCFSQRPLRPDAGNMAEAFAYISGAISLLGLFISIGIFSSKK